jgi:hypothetical protein
VDIAVAKDESTLTHTFGAMTFHLGRHLQQSEVTYARAHTLCYVFRTVKNFLSVVSGRKLTSLYLVTKISDGQQTKQTSAVCHVFFR